MKTLHPTSLLSRLFPRVAALAPVLSPSSPHIGRVLMLALFLTALNVLPAHAQTAGDSMAYGGASAASLTASSVCSPNGGVCSATLTAGIGVRVPYNMTLSNLYAFQSTAPASGSSCTIRIRTSTDGVTYAVPATVLSCSITPTSIPAKMCSSTATTMDVAAGSFIQIYFVEAGTCSGYLNFGFKAAAR